jgi:SAM-dependent methyltransferase
MSARGCDGTHLFRRQGPQAWQAAAGPVRAPLACPGLVRPLPAVPGSAVLCRCAGSTVGQQPMTSARFKPRCTGRFTRRSCGYVRRHVQYPSRILALGCGTGRMPAWRASGYPHERVVGVDASTIMVENAGDGGGPDQAHFAAERLAFADAAFDLVVVTLPVSHWTDKAAGLAGVGRVMAPGATLVVAGVSPDGRFPALTAWSRHRKPWLRRELPSLIAAAGFRVHHVEQARPVALIAASRPSAPQKRAEAGPSAPQVVVV